nr:reverse transcriptase domain-containing protein [Tanacetum cinerariifolium]
PKKQKSSMEDTYPNHGYAKKRILPKTRMPSHIKTYDGSEDPEDHLKIFQAAAKTERWAMPTWCHMFNSTLTENARVGKKTRHIHPSYKDTEINSSFRKGKFKPPPAMTTPVEKRNASKFCEFHGEVGHTTDECMHLKRKIEEMLKAEKLSHLIKELKQNNRKDQAKTTKKGETSGKDKPLAILTVQPWQKIAWQRITQTFSLGSVIFFPTLGEEDGTEGPMIIEAEMGGHCVHRIYVDGGSSSKILYEYCFSKFRSEIKNQLIPANTPLVGFSGEVIWPLGKISLLVRICDEERSTSARTNFMVSSKIIPLECSMVSEPEVSRPSINHVKEEKIQVAIHPKHPEQTVAIGSTLTEEGRKELCGLLRRHLDVFVWKPADMTGVPRHIANHRLNVREGCLPVRQKKMGQAPKRNKGISEKVKKLMEAGIMKEVHYHSWLSNPIMVKKHDDSWRIVSLRVPLQMLLGRIQEIPSDKMAEEDEEKTTFITSQGIFRYLKMPFGLKNAGATYQHLVDKAFQKQIGRNLEVYVDDLVIKSRTEEEVHRPVPKNPQEKLTLVTSPWPFYKWGIDIAGPFPEGPGKVKFLIVAIDYFTKWIEANPVASITGTHVKKFVWDNIVCRFGLPGESSNGETPFSLTYGTEAVISAEIGMPTLRTAEVDVAKNNEALGFSLDLLEEKREQAAIQKARNKAEMKGYYNARVRSTSFRPGDFIYRNNEASHAEDGGKLGPK